MVLKINGRQVWGLSTYPHPGQLVGSMKTFPVVSTQQFLAWMMFFLGGGGGVKSDTAVLTLTFRFLPFTLLSLFLPFFLSFAGHWEGFISVENVFRQAFRILGLDEWKGRLVVKQNFHGDFQGDVAWSFAFFSGVLDWIVWFERSLHSAQVSDKVVFDHQSWWRH